MLFKENIFENVLNQSKVQVLFELEPEFIKLYFLAMERFQEILRFSKIEIVRTKFCLVNKFMNVYNIYYNSYKKEKFPHYKIKLF